MVRFYIFNWVRGEFPKCFNHIHPITLSKSTYPFPSLSTQLSVILEVIFSLWCVCVEGGCFHFSLQGQFLLPKIFLDVWSSTTAWSTYQELYS